MDKIRNRLKSTCQVSRDTLPKNMYRRNHIGSRCGPDPQIANQGAHKQTWFYREFVGLAGKVNSCSYGRVFWKAQGFFKLQVREVETHQMLVSRIEPGDFLLVSLEDLATWQTQRVRTWRCLCGAEHWLGRWGGSATICHLFSSSKERPGG